MILALNNVLTRKLIEIDMAGVPESRMLES